MNSNHYGLKEGDKVVLDRDFNNASVVTLIELCPHFSKVKSDQSVWDVMTNRLSAILPIKTVEGDGIKWIDVNDRMPEDRPRVYIVKYGENGRGTVHTDRFKFWKVTHWLDESSPSSSTGDGWQEILTKGLPAIDEFVLWRTESGNYFVQDIDKDDNPWWEGETNKICPASRCTHWKRIVGPGESAQLIEQDKGMKEEADEYRAMLIKILESGEIYIGDQEEIASLIRKYHKPIN